MTSPYINTELHTTVALAPPDMDNNTYINLKNNLLKQVNKKCYKNYGYVAEVYEVLEYQDGVIEPENLTGSATFKITFSCKLCIPLKGSQIIAQIDRVNELLITVSNGPILIIITNEHINEDVFYTDNNNNLRHKAKEGSPILKQADFVKVTIKTVTFNDGDNKIKAIGYLNDVATDKEVESYYKDMYNSSKKHDAENTAKVEILDD